MPNSYIGQIIPGVGIGQLIIGDTEEKTLQMLGSPLERAVMPSGITKINFGPIQIWLNRERRIQQIGLYQGYQGQTSEGIHISMLKEKLKQVWGHGLAYNSDFEAYEFLNHPGLLFEFDIETSGMEYVATIYVV